MTAGDAENQTAAPPWRKGIVTYIALAAILVGYPAFRMAVAYFDLFPTADSSDRWWGLWSVILVGHWLCAGVVLAAIASEKTTLASVGLDISIFIKGRWGVLLVLFAAVAAAYYAPSYYYGDEIPEQMRSHPLGPVTAAQRVFWILMAVTAGFVEELLYRGYAITRLRNLVGLPAAMFIAIASFALMHGPSAFEPQFLGLYVVSGAIFTFLFVAMKCRRLEALIIFHAVTDMMLLAAP